MTTSPKYLPLFCPKCEYNLNGLTEDRCPECGNAFDPREIWSTLHPNAEPIGKLDLIHKLSYQAAICTVLALAVAVLSAIYFESLVPFWLCALALLASLYLNAGRLVPRLLANMNTDDENALTHRRRLLLLRWGVPLLFTFQVFIAGGVVTLFFVYGALFVPKLMQ